MKQVPHTTNINHIPSGIHQCPRDDTFNPSVNVITSQIHYPMSGCCVSWLKCVKEFNLLRMLKWGHLCIISNNRNGDFLNIEE